MTRPTASLRALRALTTALALGLVLTACGGTTDPLADDGAAAPEAADELPTGDGDAPVTAGMCVEDQPDCEDMIAPGQGSAACLEGDPDCTDESSGGQDLATPVLLTDSSSNAEVIAEGTSSGATGQLITAAFPVDDTTLELTFSGGACDVLEDVLVTETETEVRVLVLAGQSQETDACTQQVVEWRTEVSLAAPLGDRALLDLAG